MDYYNNEELYKKKLQDINFFIKEFGINKSTLAKKMGMADSSFRLKLSCNTKDRFIIGGGIDELGKLLKIIRNISKKSLELTIVDFEKDIPIGVLLEN